MILLQKKIEHKWFLYNRGKQKEVYLYDITGTYFEGTQNALSAFGYNRDKKKGKMQINIGLVTAFSQKNLDRYKLRVERILSKRHVKKYYEIKEVNDDEFIIDFKAGKYQQSKQLAGKYVVCTGISKKQMPKEEVRQHYKNLQNVEHAFRDFKSDNIQIRPVYHRNEAQTRGHVLISMFSYAIIKELENKFFPFLKSWNKKNNCKLSFNDMLEELKDIKLVELSLGKNVDSIKITELNEIQTQLLNMFHMKKKDLEIGL